MNESKVSIVIPAYNAQETIAKAIKGCLNQKFPYKYEVVVVDDGSFDSTADIAKSFPVKYIYQENAGPAKARNKGWRSSMGDVICFTDSDCIPYDNWVLTLINGFCSIEIGAVAGSYDIANKDGILAECIHEEIKFRHASFGKYIKAFGSYNVAIRRDVLEITGGYNESYTGPSGEDNELSYKIIKAGYKIVFNSDALVSHHHPESVWKYLKEQYRHGFWRMKLYKDFPYMVTGDDYTRFKDAIEPPLSIMVLGALPFIWHKYGFFVFNMLLITIIFLQIPTAISIIIRKRKMKLVYLAAVSFLRAFARGLGMIRGILKFWMNVSAWR